MTYHLLSESERLRITCSKCGEPAAICRPTEWTVGKRNGISFFYYCENCDPKEETEN